MHQHREAVSLSHHHESVLMLPLSLASTLLHARIPIPATSLALLNALLWLRLRLPRPVFGNLAIHITTSGLNTISFQLFYYCAMAMYRSELSLLTLSTRQTRVNIPSFLVFPTVNDEVALITDPRETFLLDVIDI